MKHSKFRFLFENIYKVYEDGNDLEARSNMLDAAYYAGHAFRKAD